jgi:nucleoside phosphorylase
MRSRLENMSTVRLEAVEYTVGWVCAVPTELAAASEMLDEEHRLLSFPSDDNLYTLGRISDHNVVIACLPAGHASASSAATVATRMKDSFPKIRFGLIVGIGSGVPSGAHDIRLGDVVVSQPIHQLGGVVQYDLKKTLAGGHHDRHGWLNAPPPVLLNALSKIQANHLRRRIMLGDYISATNHLADFIYQGAEHDVLFKAAYSHVDGPTCDRCSRQEEETRTARPSSDATVHYGTIASGSQIIADGVTRDRLSSELGGVLCFETEAAGLMNHFPCLVIRGICDYADSHVYDRWKGYAAATAAAYAKELISLVPPGQLVIGGTSPNNVLEACKRTSLHLCCP